MITVHLVRPASGGFGEYEEIPDAAEYPDLETVEDYCDYVAEVNPTLTRVSEEHPAIRDASGRVRGQSGGTLIGWCDEDDNVTLEVVYQE